jgi:hypothetical protein
VTDDYLPEGALSFGREGPPDGDADAGEPMSLLLLWAEAVADLMCLPPRRRAQVLSALADEIRQALASAPDKELIYPWQIRQVNQAFGFEVVPVPPRDWRETPEAERVRVIE